MRRRKRPGRPSGQRRDPPSAAVLFDCDGVLADSEHLINTILAEDLTARGWRISPEQARETFLGMAVSDMLPVPEARVGPLGPAWVAEMAARIGRRMQAELQPVPGALEAVAAVRAAGIPIACASNSGRVELRAKIAALGLSAAFEGRLFSYEDVCAAEAASRSLSRRRRCLWRRSGKDCVVVEDSLLGVRAGIAAGCRVLGFARLTEASVLAAVGAETFADMAALPRLIGIARGDGDRGARPYYLWIKALHLLGAFAWMAGLFYLPRLFVYHAQVAPGSEQSELFKVMERRLLRAIMNPAMIWTWAFGLLLVLTPGVVAGGPAGGTASCSASWR